MSIDELNERVAIAGAVFHEVIVELLEELKKSDPSAETRAAALAAATHMEESGRALMKTAAAIFERDRRTQGYKLN